MSVWSFSPEAEQILALSPSEPAPLLLEPARPQAASRGPADLREQWARDAFVPPPAPDLPPAHASDGPAKRGPRELREQWARDGFVAPSALDLRTAHAFDGLALEAAHEFEALLLAPVAPLGTCSSLAPTSQDRTLTAMRGVEVVSDPTNV